MAIATEQIRELRDLTGAGIMDCKRALEEAQGDMKKASQAIMAAGIAKAEKKSDREASEGVVESYIHSGSRIGSLVELNCETDFVSRLPEFKKLAHDLTMQVAAMAPKYVDKSEIPDGDDSDPEVVCLMQQSFIKDDSKVMQELVTELAARVGENVRVKRFARFALGD